MWSRGFLTTLEQGEEVANDTEEDGGEESDRNDDQGRGQADIGPLVGEPILLQTCEDGARVEHDMGTK